MTDPVAFGLENPMPPGWPAVSGDPAAVPVPPPMARPAPPVAAPARPAPNAEDALKQQGLRMVKTATDAAEQYPDELRRTQQQMQANESQYEQQEQARLEALDPRKTLRQQAPQFADFAKQTSPTLLILTALGGKIMGLSGNNMLGALTGMIEGTSQGNMQKYQEAYNTWQENYKQQRQEHDDLQQWMSQMSKFAQGNLQRQNQIAQQGLEMIGAKMDLGKSGISAINAVTALDKTQAQLAQTNLRIAQLAEKTAKDNATTRDRNQKEVEKLSSGLARTEAAFRYIERMNLLMPKVLEKYKAKVGVLPKTLGEIYTKLQDDPEVSEFSQLSKELKSAITGLELPAGVKGNMYIEKVIGSTAPDIQTMNPSELSTSLAALSPWVKDTLDKTNQEIAVRNAYIKQAGGIEFNVSASPYASPNNYSSLEELKKAVSDGKMTREEAISFARSRQWVQ